jgi:hypothetical protein
MLKLAWQEDVVLSLTQGFRHGSFNAMLSDA